MVKKLSLTAVYESVEDGWIQARIREIPGVITAAPSRKEAEDYLLDALREYLLSFQENVVSSGEGNRTETAQLQILLSA
jgi:predicted RNase H-like HicB family nuclease